MPNNIGLSPLPNSLRRSEGMENLSDRRDRSGREANYFGAIDIEKEEKGQEFLIFPARKFKPESARKIIEPKQKQQGE